jgi:thiosulfate/3-mercaptopyruvate sulfurtransferase
MIAMLRPDDNFSSSPTSRWLVSTDWLAEHLRDGNVSVVDGSYYLPTQNRDAHAEFRDGHIPGAAFFDIEAISDDSTELPHMLPGPAHFGKAVSALGIGDGDTVVVYDNVYDKLGSYSAARVWWTFRIFGAKKVFILDGGLPKWKAENRPLEKGDTRRPPKTFNADMNVGAVATLADVRMALTDDSAQIVDARSAERFAGKAPEPRPGLRLGHMPRSFNVPYTQLIENGHFASRARIEAAFKKAGVDLEKPIITSCGSGITAAILTFALESIGKESKGLYDGSWAEWGSRPDVPVERD